MLGVYGCSVIAGAEKAMCLQWQVHSGVSSVPTTRLQNNITLSSSAYAHTLTHIHTPEHCSPALKTTQTKPLQKFTLSYRIWACLPSGSAANIPVTDTVMQVYNVWGGGQLTWSLDASWWTGISIKKGIKFSVIRYWSNTLESGKAMGEFAWKRQLQVGWLTISPFPLINEDHTYT